MGGGYGGEGNIDIDPLFCDSDNGNYALLSTSPCLGTGQDGNNIGALGLGCYESYFGPVWHVATSGNDEANGSVFEPFATIQKAVDSANSGDDIYINPGLYVENIFVGPDDQRTLTIEGLGEPEEVIIDGDNDGRVFHFDGNDGSKNYFENTVET